VARGGRRKKEKKKEKEEKKETKTNLIYGCPVLGDVEERWKKSGALEVKRCLYVFNAAPLKPLAFKRNV